jgi:hypothetical protein
MKFLSRFTFPFFACLFCSFATFAVPAEPSKGVPSVKLDDWRTLNYDTIEVKPSFIFIPLIFDKQENLVDRISVPPFKPKAAVKQLSVNDQWLRDAQKANLRERYIRYRAMIEAPQLVHYTASALPKAPSLNFIAADPRKSLLTIDELHSKKKAVISPEDNPIRTHNWLHEFAWSLQMSQAYVSKSWYQGGNNNLNFLGDFLWTVALNQNIHPKLLFENTVQYKLNISSNPQDSLRDYSISEDLFKVTTKFGLKATKTWYYSAVLQFKTQLLNNYTANTNNLQASFLTPGELNLGLGMTYNTKSKDGNRQFDLSMSPLSYNMKICRENTRVDPTSMGVSAGHHTAHQIGSSLEAKYNWKFNPSISWSSHLTAFTNYKYFQTDWENTFNFSVNKFLSTMIYIHSRYDSSSTIVDMNWKHWQLKEILSFGLSYKFSMK